MGVTATKNCRTCGDPKPLTEYYKERMNADNRKNECKQCMKARDKQRYTEKREEIVKQGTERKKKWREDNRGKDNARSSREGKRRRSAEGTFTLLDLHRMYHDQGGRCAYCNESLDKDWQHDHMLPLSRGGTNHIENIAICCPSCNYSKGNKTPEEFALHCQRWYT